jgi:protein phosphatase 1G
LLCFSAALEVYEVPLLLLSCMLTEPCMPCCPRPQDVVDFIGQKLDAGMSPTEAASALLDACLANDPKEARGVGCDNMTTVVVELKKKPAGAAASAAAGEGNKGSGAAAAGGSGAGGAKAEGQS